MRFPGPFGNRNRKDDRGNDKAVFAFGLGAVKEKPVDAAFTPFGLEANRHNVEVVIDYVFRTGMIAHRFSVDELFNDVTARLA